MEIKKETFVNADEKTTKELTFDLLAGLHLKVDEIKQCYEDHLPKCEGRFKKLENRKAVNTVAAAGGGVIGGFIAGISQWFKGIL